jgi:putative Mg2+ transporter-C (MgtC) family protein
LPDKEKKMALENLPTGYELRATVDIMIALAAGFAIGVEREFRGKPAGISTHCLVIGGSAIFTFLSSLVDPFSLSRISAQIVAGIGFLGAGIILKSELDRKITNLTTAAAIWYAAAIGMAIGYGYYYLAVIATAFAVGVPRIPNISRMIRHDEA